MRLKNIILNGFKSFADKTEFNFDSNITAIVGPNGCGKSNVVDAVKWVLGEQKKKSLRSSQMTDVIFSGSSSRKASGMAEVTITFEDVSGSDNETSELEVTRRLYKNGDSQYLINNKTCRLKDIKERFMDTGVGVSAYSIIEQGQISQLLNASKAERRVIFEEAAGISKFKAHKKEAQRKLERTEQNLLRLADIINEVQKQLRSVKLQAGKARNYVEYNDRLKKLHLSYSLAEYDKLTRKTKQTLERQNKLNDSFGLIVADVARNDSLIEELRSRISQKETQINNNDNNLIAIKSKIEQHLERIEYLKNRIAELHERKSSASGRIHSLEEQNARLEGTLAGCQYNLQNNEQDAREKEGQLATLQDMLHEINLECTTLNAQLEDEKSGVLDTVRRTAQLHNEIKSMGDYRENLSNQKNRLFEKISSSESQLEKMLTDKAVYQARMDDISDVINQLQSNLDEKRELIEVLDAQISERAESMSELKESRSAVESEIKILTNMESNREGLNKGVKKILHAKNNEGLFSYIDGIVADILRADNRYAKAVEAVLGSKADSLIVTSTSKFTADRDKIDAFGSRIEAICLDRINSADTSIDLSNHDCVIDKLSNLVHYDPEYKNLVSTLLGKAFLIDNIDNAMAISKEAGNGYLFVTPEADILENGCFLKVGKLSKGIGIISRKSRLHELSKDLDSINSKIADMQDFIDESNNQSEHINEICRELRTSIYEANTEKVNTNTKLEVVSQSIDSLEKQQPAIKNEIDAIESQIKESVEREYESKQKLQELETVNTQRSDRIEELEMQTQEKKAFQEELSSQLTDLRIEIGQATVKRNALRNEISSINSQLQRGRISIESARSDMLGSDEQVSQTNRNILNTQADVSELYVEKEKAQIAASELKKDAAELIAALSAADATLRLKRSEQTEIEKQIHEVDLASNELKIKTQDLIQRVEEQLGLNIEEAYASYEEEDMDWDLVRKEINELRSKISRLGNVNVDAIDELDELEKREEFLSEQIKDLESSKGQLEKLIEKINIESREKFRETFEEVRANFREMFRKLFGGGKADVTLEEEGGDILDCGIEIIAQPPGKGAKSITLLSGGEKTMAAIALQFSIFKSKPSPFCFLDEVDAALDEANNERFNLVVKEFEATTQFIVVTHAKRTMSIADTLFGVTMQQQGVSKKISVQFASEQDSPAAVA